MVTSIDELLAKTSPIFLEVGIHDPDGWIGILVENHAIEYYTKARLDIESRIGTRTACWITDSPEIVYRSMYREGDCLICRDKVLRFACISLFRHCIVWSSLSPIQLNPRNYTDREIFTNTTSGYFTEHDCNQIQGSKAGH